MAWLYDYIIEFSGRQLFTSFSGSLNWDRLGYGGLGRSESNLFKCERSVPRTKNARSLGVN